METPASAQPAGQPATDRALSNASGMRAAADRLSEKCRRPLISAIVSNAAPLSLATKERIVDYFGDGILRETCGSTEAAIVTLPLWRPRRSVLPTRIGAKRSKPVS